ncbi:MAG: hypothetical protein V4596_14310 [Bdellovibrionota bacterium]
MKKAKQIHKKQKKLTPNQVVEFLDNFQSVIYGKDKKTKLISLRVPENILESFKTLTHGKNQKYQSIIVQLMRDWVKNNR